VTNLLDQRLGRSRTKRHAKRGHGRTHRPSELAMSPMASDLRRASRAWLRAATSCSRDARDCSSSSWTSEEQA
jgi:hypothetical protein